MISSATLIILILFFVNYAAGVAFEGSFSFFEVTTGVASLLSAIFLGLDIVFRVKPPRSHYVILAFLFLLGTASAQDLYAIETARAAGAESVASQVPDLAPAPIPPTPPNPNPPPGPVPEELCAQCQGTGKVRSGDGLSWMNCTQCGGDGKLGVSDLVQALYAAAQESGRTRQQLEAVQKEIESIKSLSGSPVENISSPSPAQARQPETRTLNWVLTLSEAKQRCYTEHKPVFIYWTSRTCLICPKFEETILQDPIVVAALNKDFIIAKLYIEDQSQEVQERMHLVGAPMCTVVKRDYKEYDHIMEGWDERKPPQDFVQSLNQSLTWAWNPLIQKIGRFDTERTGQTCNCATTGVCTCGDNCNCPDCPARGKTRYAVQYTTDRNAYVRDSIGWASTSGGSSGGYGGSAAVYYVQPQVQYYQAAPEYYSGGCASGMCVGGNCN